MILRNVRVICALIFCSLLVSCENPFADNEPIVLTFWHVYGGQTNSPMNRLVTQFNQTVGAERGIVVNVTSVSNSTAIHFPLVAAAKGEPGASQMPDLFTAYPKNVLGIGTDILVNWQDVFSPDVLEEYVPSFLQEGMADNKLLIFPVTKSTSMLFLNDTMFTPFAQACGISYNDLATWEGVFRVARAYHTYSGGKAFFKYDDWLHYSMVQVMAHDSELFVNGKVDFSNPYFARIWKQLAMAAVQGDVCLLPGYSTTAMMTGEAVCGVESSASILYFKDTMTLSDNTTQPLMLKILPVPYFAQTTPLAIQRGMGLASYKTTPEKAAACGVFIRWLTEDANSVPFVTQAGYIPVKKNAYKEFFDRQNPAELDPKVRALYEATNKVYAQYTFVVPPYFPTYGEVEKKFCTAQQRIFVKYKAQWDGKSSLPDLADVMFDEFRRSME